MWARHHWLAYIGSVPRLAELSGTDLRVYLLIDAEARTTPAGCTLSIETMARLLGLHPRTVRRSLARNHSVGLVFSLRRADLPSVRFAIDPLDAGALRRVRSGIDWHAAHEGREWAEAARAFFNSWRCRVGRCRRGIRQSLRASATRPDRPAPKGGHLCHPSGGTKA